MKSTIHNYAFFRDQIIDFAEAKISVMNHTFMYGTAVFEGIRAYYNSRQDKLFVLSMREHLERLEQNCKIMRFKLNYSVDDMQKIIIELLQKNQPKCDSYIRPSWFKDSIRIGPSLINEGDVDSFVVTTINLGDYLDTSKGIRVQTSSWRRLADTAIPARAKINGSYVNTALAKADSQLNGYDDAIFLNEDGHVAEGSAMNLFIVRNNKLITSNLTDNILEGITRHFIIEIASKELGLETESRAIDRSELYIADEVFFCGTGAQIVGVGEVDHYTIGDGEIGTITQQLQNCYREICLGKKPEYSDKLIEV